jgi:CheY-like chemotaxis protein
MPHRSVPVDIASAFNGLQYLVLDVQLPDLNGLDLQRELKRGERVSADPLHRRTWRCCNDPLCEWTSLN